MSGYKKSNIKHQKLSGVDDILLKYKNVLPQQYGFCNGSIYIIFNLRPLDILYQHLKIKFTTLQNNSNDKAAMLLMTIENLFVYVLTCSFII